MVADCTHAVSLAPLRGKEGGEVTPAPPHCLSAHQHTTHTRHGGRPTALTMR
jgi:hypothetical protein|eukprot:COSAG01_NODE_3548_length_5952_cov_7.082564_7_plen_52_part_00